ncbi:hypothetical protein D3C73_1439490 [compost metagenome]
MVAPTATSGISFSVATGTIPSVFVDVDAPIIVTTLSLVISFCAACVASSDFDALSATTSSSCLPKIPPAALI